MSDEETQLKAELADMLRPSLPPETQHLAEKAADALFKMLEECRKVFDAEVRTYANMFREIAAKKPSSPMAPGLVVAAIALDAAVDEGNKK